MNADLNQYVREALARGLSREAIRATLTAARWHHDEINAALEAWADGEPGLPVPRRRVSLSAREAFLHLVLFAALYTSAFSTGVILFWLIERWLRDAVSYSMSENLSGLRWAVAAVVTAFPIYLWTSSLAARWLAAEPEKRASGVRRWLTYLTLFVAAQVLIGNFVGVISSLLAGEMTSRSLLKAAVVFAIAGITFGHYLGGLRRDEAEADTAPRKPSLLGRIGAAGVVVALIAAFASMGSPMRARTRELDTRRVNDLGIVQMAIERRFDASSKLPESLLDLDSGRGSGFVGPMPTDPVTRQLYEYVRMDSLHYQLGALFDTADTLDAQGTPVVRRWRHGAGRHMYERSVARGERE